MKNKTAEIMANNPPPVPSGEATPRPWKSESNEIYGAEGTKGAFVVCKMACGGISPAPIFRYIQEDQKQFRPTVEANTALIVKAVNEYDALCAVAEEAAQLCNELNNLTSYTPKSSLEKAIEALQSIRNGGKS